MSRIVDGFQNQIWRVVRYDGLIETEEEVSGIWQDSVDLWGKWMPMSPSSI